MTHTDAIFVKDIHIYNTYVPCTFYENKTIHAGQWSVLLATKVDFWLKFLHK